MLEPDERRRWQRNMDAILRKIGDQDPEGIAELVQLLDQTIAEVPTYIAHARGRYGYSWTDIGRALGVSRQAARQRFAITEERAQVESEQQLMLV